MLLSLNFKKTTTKKRCQRIINVRTSVQDVSMFNPFVPAAKEKKKKVESRGRYRLMKNTNDIPNFPDELVHLLK